MTVSLFSCQEQETEVIICSSIHGLHNSNSNYSFDDLFEYLDNLDPNIIGVEIRQEDVDSSVYYLKKYYPFEMHEIVISNNSKVTLGFNWLGSSIEGKSIPENYFKELDIMKLQREANSDSLFQETLTSLEIPAGLKDEIASNSTMIALNGGRYDSLNSIYYHLMDSLYLNTPITS